MATPSLALCKPPLNLVLGGQKRNMQQPKVQLRDGSDWIDHEDCIVGNTAGIKALRNACDEALQNGEHYSNQLGDYVGVKKLPDDWFEDPSDSTSTTRANYIFGLAILLILALAAYGVVGIFS